MKDLTPHYLDIDGLAEFAQGRLLPKNLSIAAHWLAANSKAVAACTDMAAALKACRECFESLPASQHERTTDAYQLVLAALKKAGVAV